MCNEISLTQKQLDILSYVQSNGGFGVPVYPRVLKQNKNFYQRVQKLEALGLVIVHRCDGAASEFDITSEGRKYLNELIGIPSQMEKENDKDFLISLIKSSSLSCDLKSKVVEVLS